MKIQKVDINSIIENPDNPRTIGKIEFEKLVKSIKDFPLMLSIRPIVINNEKVVLGGNMRLKACKEAGLKEVHVIKADDLTPEQQKEFIIKDNVGFGAWDWDKLGNDFDAAQLSEWGLDALGIEQDKPEAKEDDFTVDPDGEKNIFIKLGDLIELGRHRVLCGDSTERSNYKILIDNQEIDLLLTDPPYGVGIDGQKASTCVNPKHNKKAHEFLGWDKERPSDELFKILLSFDIATIIWGGNYFADLLPATRGWLYWGKKQNDCLDSGDGELAWTNKDKVIRAFDLSRGSLSGSVHPTQKPVKLIDFCIKYSETNSGILDPFLGSGTTLIASDQLKRICYGMEISPKYCQVIIKRYKQYCEDNNQEFVCKINGELIPEQYL